MQLWEIKKCEALESYKTVKTLPFTSHAPWNISSDFSASSMSIVKTLPWCLGLGVDCGFLTGYSYILWPSLPHPKQTFWPAKHSRLLWFLPHCAHVWFVRGFWGCLPLLPTARNFFCYWKLGLNFEACSANPFLKLSPVDLVATNFLLQSSTSRHLFTKVGKSRISIGPMVARISSHSPPSNLTHFHASSGFCW